MKIKPEPVSLEEVDKSIIPSHTPDKVSKTIQLGIFLKRWSRKFLSADYLWPCLLIAIVDFWINHFHSDIVFYCIDFIVLKAILTASDAFLDYVEIITNFICVRDFNQGKPKIQPLALFAGWAVVFSAVMIFYGICSYYSVTTAGFFLSGYFGLGRAYRGFKLDGQVPSKDLLVN